MLLTTDKLKNVMNEKISQCGNITSVNVKIFFVCLNFNSAQINKYIKQLQNLLGAVSCLMCCNCCVLYSIS